MSLPDRLPRDADLCARIRRGDERAFRELFETYYVPLCRFATTLVGSRDASEDLVQGLFAKLWEQRETWVVRGNVRSYLYQAVHRRAVDEWRATRVRQLHVDRELHAAPVPERSAPESWPDRVTESTELQAAFERAVAALPPRARQAFDLHCQHGFTYREVGEVMGISARTVEAHVVRALLVLRKALAAYLSVVLLLSSR